MRFVLSISLLLTLIFLGPTISYAHPLAPSLLQLNETPTGMTVRWKTSNKSAGPQLTPRLPEHCQFSEKPLIEKQNDAVVVSSALSCDSLIGQSIGINNIENSISTVLLRYHSRDGNISSQLLDAKKPDIIIPASMTSLQVMQEYLNLGVEHLLEGLDHILFIIALTLLITNLRRLLLVVSLFTLGHSLTLALSVFNILNTPSTPVEILIAASIVFLAAELLKRDNQKQSLVEKHLWILPLVFGLLHGLGFASALSATGIPNNDIPTALLAFNIGIELGQIFIILTVVGSLFLYKKTQLKLCTDTKVERRAMLLSSYSIGCISAYWCIERVLGIVG